MKTSITVILVLTLLPSLSSALTIRVPMDLPTIEAGMEAAVAGDTVEVACGTYYEHGIALKGGVLLRSETGQANCVTIDGQFLGPVIRFDAPQEIPRFDLKGLTFTRGDSAGLKVGIFYRTTLPGFGIDDCVFVNNRGPGMYVGTTKGGYVSGSSFNFNSEEGVLSGGHGNKFFSDCDFIGNGGGGVSSTDIYAHFELSNCLIEDNGGLGAKATGGAGNFLDVYTCQIIGNGSGGIWGGGPDLSVRVLDSEISENEGDGIYSTGTGFGVIVGGCTIQDNQGHGIQFGSEVVANKNSGKAFPVGVSSCQISGNGLNGVYFGHSWFGRSLSVSDCEIVENGQDGVGAYTGCPSGECSIQINRSTIAANGRHGIASGSTISSEVNQSLIAFNAGYGVYVSGEATPRFISTDIFGNLGGDWVGDIAPQIDAPGNFSADPCFCGEEYTVAADSPCLPENHPWEWNTQVGALGMGCGGGMCNGPIAIENSSWGTVKALYH